MLAIRLSDIGLKHSMLCLMIQQASSCGGISSLILVRSLFLRSARMRLSSWSYIASAATSWISLSTGGFFGPGCFLTCPRKRRQRYSRTRSEYTCPASSSIAFARSLPETYSPFLRRASIPERPPKIRAIEDRLIRSPEDEIGVVTKISVRLLR
jgi:hypothetical protein